MTPVPAPVPARGNVLNLLSVFHQSRDWERETGRTYYTRQYQKIEQIAHSARYPHTNRAIGAFAALSPNSSETSNYLALEACLGRITGSRAPDAKVAAYPANTVKAMRILLGEPVLTVLGGNKVRAFYLNTLNPLDNTHLTIDGHMLGAWVGQRLLLRRDAQIHGDREYNAISGDMRYCAATVNIPAPHFQAILWLTWKRLHNVLYNPQLAFEF